MQIIETIADLRNARRAFAAGSVGLVPTMGALHAGHLSLVRCARRSCVHTVATIFVNPLQFGPTEDLDRYPRTFAADCALLEAEGVDVLFAPSQREMYPNLTQTWVDVPAIGAHLDGASRKNHFRGVATVVAKLFHLVQPDRAFFGQKDAAQSAVLRAMVRDLNFDLELIVCPTIRDPDGLALSSRNSYLSPAERAAALVLSRSLRVVEQAASDAERTASALRKLLLASLQAEPLLRLDYAEIVDPEDLQPLTDPTFAQARGGLVAVAAWLGETRLIDNVMLAAGGLR